ncbi:cobalamin-binding protein [Shewanella schlegeliana]|uniref:Cobalamin-binding protein n=1 Tax=Shewanella schlegeliana TaxID=190308 RepID=A0ABS1T2H6_9GAMM|nr:cobalamin-binding protein [Shewanella schlegeliana]MBL4914435.1 cobalamin-binding protein [Shewanella schlegeliana]MCL1109341.1 cobalamin-binding protein [Shewanella schlegeliana]GIU31656.1 cobalamin-binding protein [Shewanella schlegeliana]
MNILYKLFVALSLFISGSVFAAEPAKRIVALSPHSVEMLYAIGAGESIVATTDHADFPEAALAIPRIGGYYGVQIERILELEPDLVVVWGSGNKAEDITRIKELGFRVFDSNPSTLEAVADELESLGELTGHQVQAAKVADDYRRQLKQLRSDNAAKPEVSVFYQLWSTPLMTVAKNSWIQQIIAVCHGDNVFIDAASDYPQVSLETVVLQEPEVILQSQDEGNIIGVDWSEWAEIPAVKNEHIYQLNADLLHRAAPRALFGIEALCDALDKAR